LLTDRGLKPSPKHEIDRIDNDGPWATKIEQANNTRRNRLTQLPDGRILTLTQAARAIGWPSYKLVRRVNFTIRRFRRCEAKVHAQTFTRDPRYETPMFLLLRSWRNAGGVNPFAATKLDPRLTREERREYFKAVWAGQAVRWREPHPAVTRAIQGRLMPRSTSGPD
jgi:hypothetical protein